MSFDFKKNADKTNVGLVKVYAQGIQGARGIQGEVGPSADTSSFLQNSITSSLVFNSSTSSFLTNSITSSLVFNSATESFLMASATSSLVFLNMTSSMAVSSSRQADTASYAPNFSNTNLTFQTGSVITHNLNRSIVKYENALQQNFIVSGSSGMKIGLILSASLTASSNAQAVYLFANESSGRWNNPINHLKMGYNGISLYSYNIDITGENYLGMRTNGTMQLAGYNYTTTHNFDSIGHNLYRYNSSYYNGGAEYNNFWIYDSSDPDQRIFRFEHLIVNSQNTSSFRNTFSLKSGSLWEFFKETEIVSHGDIITEKTLTINTDTRKIYIEALPDQGNSSDQLLVRSTNGEVKYIEQSSLPTGSGGGGGATQSIDITAFTASYGSIYYSTYTSVNPDPTINFEDGAASNMWTNIVNITTADGLSAVPYTAKTGSLNQFAVVSGSALKYTGSDPKYFSLSYYGLFYENDNSNDKVAKEYRLMVNGTPIESSYQITGKQPKTIKTVIHRLYPNDEVYIGAFMDTISYELTTPPQYSRGEFSLSINSIDGYSVNIGSGGSGGTVAAASCGEMYYRNNAFDGLATTIYLNTDNTQVDRMDNALYFNTGSELYEQYNFNTANLNEVQLVSGSGLKYTGATTKTFEISIYMSLFGKIRMFGYYVNNSFIEKSAFMTKGDASTLAINCLQELSPNDEVFIGRWDMNESPAPANPFDQSATIYMKIKSI